MGINLKGEDDLRETNINKRIAFKNVKVIIYKIIILPMVLYE
jgi:hypothetical protein